MNPLAALLRRAAGDPRPDGALLAAFLAGRDEAAFAEVVRRHGGPVWGAYLYLDLVSVPPRTPRK